MNEKELEIIKDGVAYKVIVTYKRQRNVYFRYRDNIFYVSAPFRTSDKLITNFLKNNFDKIIKKFSKKQTHFSFEEDYVYLLGEKVSLSSLNIQNNDELQEYLKKLAFDVINEEVRKYEQIMEIKVSYKVKIKNTSNQYGSNSKKTHTLSFQTALVHYAIDIIDTVVVHELAHEFERNHQKGFYDIVYKYSPNYKFFQRKLKRGIHQ